MSQASQAVIVHERLGRWARQLRPRLADRPTRVHETRSWDDLEAALATAATPCPLVVIDLARRVRPGLEDLIRLVNVAPDALTLVLDPDGSDEVALLSQEFGASHVISGAVPPPTVAALLVRWLALARRRAEASGWSALAAVVDEPEPWNWLNPLIDPAT